MPPWTILDDFDDVPEAKSAFSTSAVLRPRLAASSATPAPVTPPPITRTSNCSSASRARARARSKALTRGASNGRGDRSGRAWRHHMWRSAVGLSVADVAHPNAESAGLPGRHNRSAIVRVASTIRCGVSAPFGAGFPYRGRVPRVRGDADGHYEQHSFTLHLRRAAAS